MPLTIWKAFLTAAATVIVAEIGCAVRTAALETRLGHPWAVFLGTMAGTAIVMGIATLCGTWVRDHVPDSTFRYIAAAIFIGLGLLMAANKM